MNLSTVMDQIADRLGTIDGLRVVAWPAGTITPPGAIVGYPVDGAYDETYGRGADRMIIPVVIVTGRASDRSARDLIAAYADGSGDRSIKTVLESGTYTAFDSIRVDWPEFDAYAVGSVDHIAAIFDVHIYGRGAT